MRLHPVFQRQVDSIVRGDLDALLDNYAPDATLVRFDLVAEGIDEVRETLRGYLTTNPEVVELTSYAEGGDTIFYRATMKLNGQPRDAFGTLVLRDGKIWRQTAGFSA
jgi:ketosteroid isomerase-like protein